MSAEPTALRRGALSRIARRVGVSRAYVCQQVHGQRRLTPEVARLAEQERREAADMQALDVAGRLLAAGDEASAEACVQLAQE